MTDTAVPLMPAPPTGGPFAAATSAVRNIVTSAAGFRGLSAEEARERAADLVDENLKPPTFGRTQLTFLDLATTIRNIGKGQKDVDKNYYVRSLWWISLLLALLYAASAVGLLIIDLVGAKQVVEIFWSPLRWNSISSRWAISLEKITDLRIGMLFFALTAAMSIFRIAHVFGPLRTWYSNMVYMWQFDPSKGYAYNSLRWIGHGVLIGGIVAGAVLIAGALDVFIFTSVWVAYFCFCALSLMMEMYNPIKAVRSNAFPHKQVDPEGRHPSVNWYAHVFAMLPFMYVFATFITFFALSADDKLKKLAWYVWGVPLLLLFVTAGQMTITGIYHAFTWIRLYVWMEYVYLITEAVLVIGICWLSAVGFLTD